MCRSTENHGFYQRKRERLEIRAFFLRLSISEADAHKCILPESLTLLYLPSITGNLLEINESKIRSDSKAFVTLYRVRSAEKRIGSRVQEVVYASRERVRASEGVQFEVYLREEKVLKGVFRRDDEEEWRLECKCALESELEELSVSDVEVCVGVEGDLEMNEKVEMVVRRKKKVRGFLGLEEIPEEREVETEEPQCCCCCCGEIESDLEGCSEMGSERDCGDCKEEDDDKEEMEIEMEGVRWAVDVGIWVMCLGVGFLVSKASSKRLRRRRIL